jgi:hypothetical protein
MQADNESRAVSAFEGQKRTVDPVVRMYYFGAFLLDDAG